MTWSIAPALTRLFVEHATTMDRPQNLQHVRRSTCAEHTNELASQNRMEPSRVDGVKAPLRDAGPHQRRRCGSSSKSFLRSCAFLTLIVLAARW